MEEIFQAWIPKIRISTTTRAAAVTFPKGVKAFDDFHEWDLIAGSPMTLKQFDFLQYGSVAETNIDSLVFIVRDK